MSRVWRGVGRLALLQSVITVVNKNIESAFVYDSVLPRKHSAPENLRAVPKLMREKRFVKTINSVDDFIRVEDSTAARCVLIERRFSRNFNKNADLARSAGSDKNFNQIIQIESHVHLHGCRVHRCTIPKYLFTAINNFILIIRNLLKFAALELEN